MEKIVYLTPNFAIADELGVEDFARVAAMGFRTLINNRPDGEEDIQLRSSEAQLLAARAGLSYRHIPATKFDLFTEHVVSDTISALRDLDGPVLAHCKSGMRSAIIWGAARSRFEPVDNVLGTLSRAGMDMEFLRDEFDMQADQAHWSPDTPAALVNQAPAPAALAPMVLEPALSDREPVAA